MSGLLDHLVVLQPRAATEDEILRLHTRDYVDRIKAESSKLGGDAGELTPFGAGSYEIALLAVGGCITGVDAVLDGKVDNVYALVRPPGHHAERDTGRGFCIFANVALAALHARDVRGLSRVAVVDWDVHHGNGTGTRFTTPACSRSRFTRTATSRPSRGRSQYRVQAREGYNINVPLPAYKRALRGTFERVVVPALRAFSPRADLRRLRARRQRNGPASLR